MGAEPRRTWDRPALYQSPSRSFWLFLSFSVVFFLGYFCFTVVYICHDLLRPL